MMCALDMPFGPPVASPTPDHPAAVADVLEYAIRANPDERWDICCVCGCEGNCATYDRLARGLLLLADNTLCRSAWCKKLSCEGERYSSIYIPWHIEKEQ